ncbi:hypothetical protein D3C74_445650 [compost metagenome]
MENSKRFLFEVTVDGGEKFDKEIMASSRQWAFITLVAEYPETHKISLLEE